MPVVGHEHSPRPHRRKPKKVRPPSRRQLLEQAIEQAIDELNALDGDADLEEDNEDRCEARDDDMAFVLYSDFIGDADDSEPNGDEHDGTGGEDDPDFHGIKHWSRWTSNPWGAVNPPLAQALARRRW